MLSSIRKFSSSIYAKIFLIVVAIPFIFWGMGPLFTGGNLNTIVKIDDEKISTQEFTNFLKNNMTNEEPLEDDLIDRLLSNFIGEKLLIKEMNNFDIHVSENSLGSIIRNEKIFKKNNQFSRTEYEKFLIKNRLYAVIFEENILQQEKKKQLFNFIGGGIAPSKSMVNVIYDKINQKRNIQAINLNDIINKKLKFSEDEIKSFFDQNRDKFIDIYKSIKFIELNPKNLTGNNEISDLFFQKIDEIDDLIVGEENLDSILNKYDLGAAAITTFKELDMENNSKEINKFPLRLIKNVFAINETEPTILIADKNKYFIVEVIKTENIQRKINDEVVRKNILENLEIQTRRKFISKIIEKINKNNFNKSDFDRLSSKEKITIKKIRLENQNDNKILKKELISQIYAFPEKKIIVIADIGLRESFLIYIDKIESVRVDQGSEDYKKYFNLSKIQIAGNLYNSYDSYLKYKYKININQKALDSIKNNF
jgi:peptidyl-prolyl cis-trans isomerase D